MALPTDAALETIDEPWGCRTRLEHHFAGRMLRCMTDRPAHAGALLSEAARRWPLAEALVDGERRWTFTRLDEQVTALASRLQSGGVQCGDRVALHLGNSAEFVLALLASTRAGAVVVPLSTRWGPGEIEHALADARPRALISGGISGARSLAYGDVWELVAGEPGRDDAAFEGLRQAVPWCPPGIDEDDDWAILYTSGTTGRPKGAVQTHLGIVHGALQFTRCWRLQPGERSILAVPGTHAAGLGVIFTMLACGGCTIVMKSFGAAAFLSLAAAERMSYAAMVPAMYNLLLREPQFNPAALRAWRVGGYGAAPMPPALIAAFATRMPALELVNAYGCTESTQPLVLMPPGQTATHANSVGRPVPGAELRIVQAEGRDARPGEPGEIWMRGPTVIPRYWGLPDADAEAFTDGWWHSGDIGSIDAQGYVYVHDRLKDMIVRGGHKVFSAEVEHVLAQHTAVMESAIVGVPDPVLGERVQAFVVLKYPDATDASVLADWCAAQLADYKIPERWVLQTEPLPRNANGKALKTELRVRACAA